MPFFSGRLMPIFCYLAYNSCCCIFSFYDFYLLDKVPFYRSLSLTCFFLFSCISFASLAASKASTVKPTVGFWVRISHSIRCFANLRVARSPWNMNFSAVRVKPIDSMRPVWSSETLLHLNSLYLSMVGFDRMFLLSLWKSCRVPSNFYSCLDS